MLIPTYFFDVDTMFLTYPKISIFQPTASNNPTAKVLSLNKEGEISLNETFGKYFPYSLISFRDYNKSSGSLLSIQKRAIQIKKRKAGMVATRQCLRGSQPNIFV